MSARYFCQVPGRRQAVIGHATLNGIDYLEVGDRDDGGIPLAQARLHVKFLKAVARDAFGADQVRVEDARREWRIEVVAVSWPEDEAESEFVDVDLIGHGNFTPFTLRLVQGPGHDDPPAWVDPVLGSVEFSFKAACPSDFDCAPPRECPRPQAPQPQIDYLSKDYASFRQLMLDRLSALMPQWRERSEVDLGVAAVEVLAYAADHLSYYQDAVATEAYLGTARRRVSVRRHARLLDYAMHDGCNARTFVCVTGMPQTADGYVLRATTPLLTGKSWPETLEVAVTRGADGNWTAIELRDVPAERQVFETLHDLTLHPAHTRIEFYTWGDDDCCLPQGATRASLRSPGPAPLQLAVGDLLLLEEISDASGSAADAERAHRHVVRLTEVTPRLDPLYDENVVDVAWAADDALPFALCLWRRAPRIGDPAQPVSVARGNVVLADHGRTLRDEALIPDTLRGTRRDRPRLARTDVTFAAPFDAERARAEPAAALMSQDPRGALPVVGLRHGDDTWTVRRDLLRSDRFSEDFVVETEGDGRAYLRFGDGVLGRRPAAGTQFRADYRIGGGAAGNVGADTLRLLVIPSGEPFKSADFTVTNPLPARGGVAAEAIEHVRQYAPQAFRSQQRAVIPADYAALAEQHAEVQKAVASQRWTGSGYAVFVTVDRRGGRRVDAQFEEDLRAYLEPYRLMGHDLEIEAPRMVALDIALRVCVAPGFLRSAVKKALLDVFSSRERPDGTRGLFHPDELTFGQTVYLSAVIAAAMRVPGVTWVEATRFQRWGEADRGERAAGRIDLGRLEIARLDNDPNAPANGRLDLDMQGGL